MIFWERKKNDKIRVFWDINTGQNFTLRSYVAISLPLTAVEYGLSDKFKHSNINI